MYLRKKSNTTNIFFRFTALICFAISAAVFSAPAFRFDASANISDTVRVAPASLTAEEEIATLERYDGRDYGFVTSVRDQGASNICWAYASVYASEVSVLKSGIDPIANKDDLSLSPENLAYMRHNRGADPLGNTKGEISGQDWYSSAGNPSYSASVLSQWCGPIPSGGSAATDGFTNAAYHLDNAVYVQDASIEEIKRLIAKYGAVTFAYNNLRETEYYNPKNESGTASSPHACTLIGWDDTIPAGNFVPGGASRDGGFLVKNSYSSLPYFYLSYDNKCSEVYAFDYTVKDVYSGNYFYDYSLTDGLNYSLNIQKAANIYEAKRGGENTSEYVNAVNVGFYGKNVTCKVKIYTNLSDEEDPESGTLAGEGNAFFEYGGYRTVKLDNAAKVDKGTLFSAVVEIESASGSAVIRFMQGGNPRSFAYRDYWSRRPNTARIKAFTSVSDDEAPPTENADLTGAEVTVEDKTYVYTGGEIRPRVTVTLDGRVLVQGEDHDTEYFDNVDAGRAGVTVKGKGGYVGQKTVNFTIVKAHRPPVIPVTISVANNIARLADVPLPEGWTWVSADTALLEGENEDMRAEYFDKTNYEDFTADVKVIREILPAPKPPPETDPSGDEDSGNSGLLWLLAIPAVAFVAAATTLPIIFVKKRRMRQSKKEK